MTTATVRVRAVIEPSSDARFDRLRDPFARAILLGEPLARDRVATRWPDTDALKRLVDAKRRPLDGTLARELRAYNERLGASAASLANLDRLARGEAVASIAGQQPALLGGPLFALHKTAATLGLAARVTARTQAACVPIFWTHAEDSDFDEIRGATVSDAGLALTELALPAHVHHEGALVGDIALAPAAALTEQALAVWAGLPAHAAVAALARGAAQRARDLGELQSAIMLALFGDQGLVVVDPRLPGFRAAARAIIDRYLVNADAIGAAARAAGARLEAATGRRPLADASLDSFVFAIDGGVRRKVAPATAREHAVLTPSVALRPVVQDGVLPTVAMACGPGELAYLAQLREVFEALNVLPAAPVPRFGATWLPPAAVALLEASSGDAWELVVASDAVIKRMAEERVPGDLRAGLERSRAVALAELDTVSKLSTRLDASLPQLVESARGKVDYQFARLAEGVVGKARQKLEREHPEWLRVRYYLSPGDKLQERRIATLEPVAYRGAAVGAELAPLAEAHAERLEAGVASHVVLEL